MIDKAQLRERGRAFTALVSELMEVALSEDLDVDEGDLTVLLPRLVGHIQYSGLQYLFADPSRPTLINTQFSPWNWGNSNPDTLYQSAAVRGDHNYRVFGTLGSASQTTFGVYTGEGDQNEAVKLLSEEIEVEPNGRFEIFFTQEKQGVNWFRPPRGAQSFASYQTFSDWETETKGAIRIECLDRVPMAGPPSAADTLELFDSFLERSKGLFLTWVKEIPARIFSHIPDNGALPPLQPPSAMTGAWFTPMKWRLEDGHALVIDFRIPQGSPYSGVCLTDHWGGMIDIETRQTSLNRGQSIVEEDGSVRLLLSTKDLGVHNWLDARGHSSGIVTWRTSHEKAPEPVKMTVISESDVQDCFGEAMFVGEAERLEAIRRRQRHFADRNSI